MYGLRWATFLRYVSAKGFLCICIFKSPDGDCIRQMWINEIIKGVRKTIKLENYDSLRRTNNLEPNFPAMQSILD